MAKKGGNGGKPNPKIKEIVLGENTYNGEVEPKALAKFLNQSDNVTITDLKITKNKEESKKQNADVYEHTSSWKGQTIVNRKPQTNNNNNVSINDVYVLILKMNDDMNEIKDEQKKTNSRLENVEKDIRVLKEEQKKTNSRLDRLEENMKEVKEDIKVLKDDVNVLKDEMKEVKEDIKVLKDDVNVLKDEMKEVKEDINEIKNCPTIKKELKK